MHFVMTIGVFLKNIDLKASYMHAMFEEDWYGKLVNKVLKWCFWTVLSEKSGLSVEEQGKGLEDHHPIFRALPHLLKWGRCSVILSS